MFRIHLLFKLSSVALTRADHFLVVPVYYEKREHYIKVLACAMWWNLFKSGCGSKSKNWPQCFVYVSTESVAHGVKNDTITLCVLCSVQWEMPKCTPILSVYSFVLCILLCIFYSLSDVFGLLCRLHGASETKNILKHITFKMNVFY